jgi:K+-transporting ATPase KdpF subunit
LYGIKTISMSAKLIISIASVNPDVSASGLPVNYLIGAIIAILIMGYLFYILINPEKF